MGLKENIANMKLELAEMEKQLKEEEIVYPIFKKSKSTGHIVKFAGLNEGVTVMQGNSIHRIGHKSNEYIAHTNNATWKDIPYDKERDLFHGQPVYCWDNETTHGKAIRFYDALNRCVFHTNGLLDGYVYDNYEGVLPEHYTQWMLEAYTTLEGI